MTRVFTLTREISQTDLLSPVQEFMEPLETLNYICFQQTLSCEEVLDRLPRDWLNSELSHYCYTLNDDSKLMGVISVRQLTFANPKAKLEDLAMPHVIRIHQDAPIHACLKLMIDHRLTVIPVTNKKQIFLGILDMSRDLTHLGTPDRFFQLLGFHLDDVKNQSTWRSFCSRMPWLISNILSGLGCAYIADYYELVLDKVVVISMFIPLVLTLGESIAVQSMSLSLDLLDYNELPWKLILKRLRTEFGASILMGLCTIIMVATAYTVISNDFHALGAISVSICFAMALATQIGTLLPIVLHRLRLDPKVAAGPVALMITDLCVTSLYLGLSTHWLLPI